MELVIDSLFTVFLLLACISFVMLICRLWLDIKGQKQMDEVVDMYLEATRLRYKAMLDELAKEDDGR